MKQLILSKILGFLVLLSCLLTAPQFLSSAKASYIVGMNYGGFFWATALAISSLLGWLLTFVGGWMLFFKRRSAVIILTITLILSAFWGGPLFLPFLGMILPVGWLSFAVVNLIVVCLSYVATKPLNGHAKVTKFSDLVIDKSNKKFPNN